MSIPYEPPFIQRLESGHMNKFGGPAPLRRKVRSEIAGASVAELVARFGSPLFVFDEAALRRRFRAVRDAFATRYPKVVMGWSYKTNYLRAICAALHDEGAYAEVVSRMEYEKAKNLGVPGDRILFNGPNKSRLMLETAVDDGAAIHVDHLDEILDLEAIAQARGRKLSIGLRLNLDAGIQPQWSRFGFNLECGQALQIVERIARAGWLKLDTLHCHIGTFILDPCAYGRQVSKMLGFAYQIEDRFGFRIATLDIGGGLPSKNRLKGVYHAADVLLPSLDEYAEAVASALRAGLRPGHQPRLVIESGRAVIDEAGSLIAEVRAVKRLADGTRAYVLDSGVNLLFTSYWYRFDIALARPHAGPCENSVLYGPMCMNIDVVDEGLPLPPLPRGAHLVISPVGAYNPTQWQQFIEYRPAVVMIGSAGEIDLIREGEDLSDVERRERLPARLNTSASGAAQVLKMNARRRGA